MRGDPRKHVSTSRDPVTCEQVAFFSILLNEFVEAAHSMQSNGRPLYMGKLVEHPAYNRFMRGAYACGLVCSDMSPDETGKTAETLKRDPSTLLSMPWRRVREYVHYMMRAERWAYQGADFGGGFIRDALVDGHLRLLAARLRQVSGVY